MKKLTALLLLTLVSCNRQTVSYVETVGDANDCHWSGAQMKTVSDLHPKALIQLGAFSGYGAASTQIQDMKKVLLDYKNLDGSMDKIIYGLRPDVNWCPTNTVNCWYGKTDFKMDWVKKITPENKAWSIAHLNGGRDPFTPTCTSQCGKVTWNNWAKMQPTTLEALYDGNSVVMDMGNKEYQEWFAKVAIEVFLALGLTTDDAFVFEFSAKPGNANYWDEVGPGGNCYVPGSHTWGGCGMARQQSVYGPGEFEKAYNGMMVLVGLRMREVFPKARFITVERPSFKTTWSLVSDTNTNLLLGEEGNRVGSCTN